MRLLIISLLAAGVAGCSTTRTVQSSWDEAMVAEVERRSGRHSIWRTSDGVFEPRQLQVTVDSVVFRTDIALGVTPHPVSASFHRRDGSAYYWQGVPAASVLEVSFTRRRRDFGSGLFWGALTGGVVFGTIAAIEYYDQDTGICTGGAMPVDGRCDSPNPLLAAFGGAALVGISAGLVTGAIGARETTIFQFGRSVSLSLKPQGLAYRVSIGR